MLMVMSCDPELLQLPVEGPSVDSRFSCGLALVALRCLKGSHYGLPLKLIERLGCPGEYKFVGVADE